MNEQYVKECTYCGAKFRARDFLEDQHLEPIGMMIDESDPSYNIYFFNHTAPGCGTTLAIPVETLIEFIDEPVVEAVKTGDHDCEGHCLTLEDLSVCSQECHYAPFRRLLIRMMDRRPSSR